MKNKRYESGYLPFSLKKILAVQISVILLLIVSNLSLAANPNDHFSGSKNEILGQQDKSITGVVTDRAGSPMPGVTVIVEGTTIGTITDGDGKFTLQIPSGSANLHVSFVGMATQIIPIGDKSSFAVSLLEETIGLEEVVAVGYGTQTKRTVTGAIQTVSGDDLKDIPAAQVVQTLQGKVSGVQITQRTGQPGEALSVRVRNAGSINAGNSPLYVVDGFPIDGDLTGINPEEIESITVLKDASSTALYGSRAANGVILVETKRAKAGKTSINFSAYYGVQKLPEKGRVEMMNGQEFAQFKKETYEDRGVAVPSAFQNPAQYGEGTNWYGIMFEPAPIQDYTLTLMAGNEKQRTTVVAGYFNQEGVMLNSGYERFSLRINSEFNVNEYLSFGFNLAPSYSEDHSPNTGSAFWAGNLLYNALLAWPILPYKNDDGTLPMEAWIPGLSAFPTPNYYRAAQEIEHNASNMRLLSNAYIQVEPIEGLKLKSSINLQANYANTKDWNPSTSFAGFAATPPITAFVNHSNTKAMTWLNENTATYDLSVADDHQISLLGGYTVQKFMQTYMSLAAENFPDDRINDVDAAITIRQNGTDTEVQEWALLSYLGRVNYSYLGKYNLSAVVRRDGSSRFGEDNRWGVFPSVSGSWVVSDESFFPETDIVKSAKVRASWGETGNNNIGNYTHFALVNLGQNAIFGSTVASGSNVANLSNTELGWETSRQFDLGIDVGLFNNRLDIAYDYYNKSTFDMLYSFQIPQSSGYSSFTGNSGEFKFWGHEFSIHSRNMVGDFKWETNLMISFGDNEVVSLADNVDALYTGAIGARTISKVGERIGLFWGLVHEGVYDNQAEYDSSPKAASSIVGSVKFKDVDGDGIVTNTDLTDRTVIGDPTPKFLFGMTNSFSYKNFDMSITMSGSYGNDIANGFDQGTTNLDGVFNIKKEIQDRWRSPENPGSGKYGTTNAQTFMERDWFNSRFIEDGSHLTIKNVTLGYNFNLNSNIIKSLRVYGSAQQLYTFTKYSGNNPEVSDNTNVLTLGIDNAIYPIPRTFTFGVNVDF